MIIGTQGQDEAIVTTKKKVSLKAVIAIAGAVAVSALLLPTIERWYKSIPSIDKESLRMAQVTRGDLIRDVAVNGKIVAANAPQLYSTEPGQVTMFAKPGESVEKGQIVAQVQSPELSALIEQQESTLEQLKIEASRGEWSNKEALLNLESELNSAQIRMNVATREKQRADESIEKQVISEKEWAQSQDNLLEAEMLLTTAKKRVALAKERLVFENRNREYVVEKQLLVVNELKRRQQALEIAAPVSGIVGNWLIAQKDKVSPSTPIMTVVDLSEYEAELNVPEFYADDLGIGLQVAMTIAGQNVEGSIIAISPEIKGGQVQVRANVKNMDALSLRQNQRLNARIEFEKKDNVLMVKRGQFLSSSNGTIAYKLNDLNSAVQIPISTGLYSVDYIELISGVQEGDTIIISDYETFNSAQQIEITQ
ncbi:efflux RND transporter periplasmic adaptor subunit [Thalassotalea marina]|uniref:RND transporter MFP subunit n=1 Tax=Thalassotalea marina TaxID=1673741 RepID=A0A919BHX4_9GAMM|nr:HlyD family efflux transporter periplasmic adaptor subunit [Thalassotalea marina]GHF92718.1 RND transporter MFP subunit [Thalassotalea marina]